MKIATVATVPDHLAKAWLQHLRDFDTAHPGCHFQITAEAPEMSVSEIITVLKVEPKLDTQLVILRRDQPKKGGKR